MKELTEREVKQLVKLLDRFRVVEMVDLSDRNQVAPYNSAGEQTIIHTVGRWVRSYASDVKQIDI